MHLPESLQRNSSTPHVICAGEKETDVNAGRGALALLRHFSSGLPSALPLQLKEGGSRRSTTEAQIQAEPHRLQPPTPADPQGPSGDSVPTGRPTHVAAAAEPPGAAFPPPDPPPPPREGSLLQLAGSSEPSTQSLSRSHTQTRGMQRLVMAHWNWLGAHVTSAAGGEGVRGGSRQAGLCQPPPHNTAPPNLNPPSFPLCGVLNEGSAIRTMLPAGCKGAAEGC